MLCLRVLRCLAQLAVVPEGREALRRDPSVSDALQSVAEAGLCELARLHAESALLALSDNQLHATTEGQQHVMLSCESLCISEHCADCLTGTGAADQWDVQPTIQRLIELLIARGYATWFDLTNMKGSTVDAMSDAIEQ